MILTKNKLNIKSTTNYVIEKHPVPILGVNYKVKIMYKNIRITELNIEKNTIKILLPNKYKKMDSEKILELAIEKMYEQIAKTEIERAMEKIRIMVKFAPEEYEIKKMDTLGRCEKQKIIINPKIVTYNRDIIDYVVLHQYCHLKYKNHTRSFFNMLEKYLPNYKKCEEILLNI